jgi:hypothetical protein
VGLILTSDVQDIRRLADGLAGVRARPVAV